ncbi:uncharacterized protein [Garra rufa]|uniref:uncharacterized protein n=1 Tax=Garra rufa TaxID=137080 RepID=UPI003CCE65A0
MFYIVEFIDTQEVEVVPALWVVDDICQWPAFYKLDKLVKAITNEEQPGHKWDAYRVRVLYTAATYKIACLKLPQAETHTDLQTAEEDEDDSPKKKQKRLPNTHFECESDNEDTVKQLRTLPPTPKIKRPNSDVPSALKRPGRRPEPQKHLTGLEPKWSETSLEPRLSLTCSELQQDESQRQSEATNLSGLAPVLQRIITNQEMIMDQLKIIRMTMQNTGEPAHGQDPLERDMLPLKDTASLLALEKRLREEADLKNKMIAALSVIGGVDIKDSVWRVMKHCFTNSLAKQLNWRGINGKTAFHRLQLKDVIVTTTHKGRR